MDLLNAKCNFTNSCDELLRLTNRCNSAPFPGMWVCFRRISSRNKAIKH
jgi:hypothetical protein